MKYTYIAFMLLALLTASHANSQEITGHVYSINGSGEKELLSGGTVHLSQTKHGSIVDSKGAYSIKAPTTTDYLVASFLGFSSDSLLVSGKGTADFILVEDGLLLSKTVVVARRKGTYFSKMTPLKTEMISQTGLMKMACCNLAESFENSATVTVGFTDAVSGAKQIQLLGLSGVYSQMLAENIPTMKGLASTYGWSYTPGPWMEAIQISKGASSVTNGYESVSGQINLEFKKPNHTEPLFLNLFADGSGRYEGNISAATKVTDKLWTGLLLHASTESSEHDSNDDKFMDMPKTKLINLYNRWYYENPEKQIESKTGFKFLYENREGGQVSSVTDRYKTNIKNKNYNVYNKTGFAVGKEGQSIGIINSFTRHEQDSEFGLKRFDGTQNSFYSNVMLSSYINNTSHQYVTGVSFAYDNYLTTYRDSLPLNTQANINLDREEIVPGAFVQYTYSYLDKFTFIAGMRADYNSEYGWLYTPRTNLKYNITDDIIFRASAGKGYRSPNVIAENIGLMASSREFDVNSINNLDIERAWNYGANVSFYIPSWNKEDIVLSFDYFRTDFQNQAVIDIERNKDNVYFYNLNGKSYANAWQADLTFAPIKGMEVFAAFRYNDTKMTLRDGGNTYMVEKPLTSRYRGLLNVSYATNFRKWVFDVTAQVNGPSRLPSMSGYSAEKNESPAFPIYFAQITKNMKWLDVYAGVENIFNYKQDNPIINANRPFEKGFDSSVIWGPLMGRKIYVGIRFRLGEAGH